MSNGIEDLQHHVARVLLAAIGEAGFVLAGAGAIRTVDVDLAANWRADIPVQMRVGPVLSESDAVAGKLSAVYSRGEVRDFLDLDAIRSSGRYTDSDLLALGRKHDAGFEVDMFAAQLSRVMRFDALEAEEYGVTPTQFDGVQQRIQMWATSLGE